MRVPGFAQGDGVDAVAEFKTFLEATLDVAAHLLAELTMLHSSEGMNHVPGADVRATTARGIFCREIKGWAVFYTVGPFDEGYIITVLYVVELRDKAVADVEGEAVRRMTRIVKHGG